MNAKPAEIAAGDAPRTKVAIVVDNATLRTYLAKLVSDAGYRCVCTCSSAEEAIVKIPECKPHVVLMDIHLPGESGIKCTCFLRQRMPEIQVIMLTVYKDMDVIFDALKAGACGYVLKRAEAKEILEAVAEVCAGGVPMTSEVARMVVRSFRQDPGEKSQTDKLSPREMEVLALAARGYVNNEIATELNISFGTLRTHLAHIFEKLHVRCRTESVAKVMRSVADPSSLAKPLSSR